jgi:Spy/CpxP family protein refolding chaperone
MSMRKNLWKAVAMIVVLALGTMAMSALAADKPGKSVPCTMSAAKAAPAAGMKGCGMQAAPAAEAKGCAMHGAAAGDMKCCGQCCCMKGGMGKSCMMGARGGKGCGMRDGAKSGCAMGAKGGQGCGMQGGAMQACRMGQKGGQAGCGMHGGMGPGGMRCGGAQAPDDRMGCGMGPDAGMGMACDPAKMKELGLTPEQQQKMADIHDRMQRQDIQAEADLRIAQLDMQKLMQSESPDRVKIEAQIDRIAGLEAAVKKARIAAQLEVRSILTPEQVRKMHAGPAACAAREEKPAKPARPAK